MLFLLPVFRLLLALIVLYRLFLACISLLESAVALAQRPATVMFQVRFASLASYFPLYLPTASPHRRCFMAAKADTCLIEQRLREAIDSRIAEEQARQRSSQESLARSNSARRPPGRNLSPSRRPSRPRRNTGTPVRGPDPTEFEQEFAIGDDDTSSRSATPRPESTGTLENTPGEGAGQAEGTANAASEKDSIPGTETNQPPELSSEVKAKLRRLNKMESRYQGMFCIGYGRLRHC
jgi:hypothetical protein